MKFKVSAIICAAGKGERAGLGKNKLLAPIFGAPALWHTLKKFNTKNIDEVIVTSSQTDFAEICALCLPFGFKAVLGGNTRTESVKNALSMISGDIVLIHDGARPYLTNELIERCIAETIKNRSAICAVGATDTVVYLDGQTTRLDRNSVKLIQTPQGFFTKDIKRAYELSGDEAFTDDSAIYQKFIATPHFIDGEKENKKLTYKSDFDAPIPPVICDGSALRVGFGVDTHAFGAGNFVILGGQRIDCDRGLVAHSDGDVLVHAVMDALLSAAGLNDIGHYFPDTSPSLKGASSIKMLEQVIKIIDETGYAPKNISISVQAEKPKLKEHIQAIKKNLSSALKLAPQNIAVAAGTCEGLGFVGEGLGITTYCTVLLGRT